MKELRALVSKSSYADEAFFSDELLLPALAEGHHLTIVTAFVPSYLLQLVQDLATSPEIEPGKLTIILCVPFPASESMSEARLLARYVGLSGASMKQTKTFFDAALSLARERGLRISALISKEDQLLTPSCIGILESGELGSSQTVSLIDSTPGDLSSPIAVQGSWEEERATLDKTLRAVSGALSKDFPTLLRKSHQEVIDLIHETRAKGFFEKDFRQEVGKPAGNESANPKKENKGAPDLVSSDSVEELDLEFEREDFAVERILREVFLREAGYEDEDVAAFLGEPDFTTLLHFDPSERQHTPSLSAELVEIVGQGYTSCWCGESFDREQGCPELYY